MSEKIRLNLKKPGFLVKVNENSSGSLEIEKEEDSLRIQLQKQFENGFNKGYSTAQKELQQTFDEKLQRKYTDIQNICELLDDTISIYEKNYEQLIINMALLFAEKIVRREIEERTIINEVIKDALKKIIGAENVIVKLHPDDYAYVISEKENFHQDGRMQKLRFESDEKIEPGGCLVESEIGNVDARINSQINELKKIIDVVLYGEVNQ